MNKFVKSEPYLCPYNGELSYENPWLTIIDMQFDFCGKGGYVDKMACDLSLTGALIKPLKRILNVCRKLGYRVSHTREGQGPDLADLPKNKRWHSQQIDAGTGADGPCGWIRVRGEPGWKIISELGSLPGEPINDKPGEGSFYATDLERLRHNRGSNNLVLTGITTDDCVHTAMRDANERGNECVLLADCCGATDFDNHQDTLNMMQMQGGVFGAVADSVSFIEVIS